MGILRGQLSDHDAGAASQAGLLYRPEGGELYDLQEDPHELHNLWDRPECGALRAELKDRLLSWLATSTYYNAGYRRTRSRHYTMRWPREEDPYLHGGQSCPIDRPVDL